MPLAFSFFGSKRIQPSPESPVEEGLSAIQEGIVNEGVTASMDITPETPFPRNESTFSSGDSGFQSKAETGALELLPTIFLPPLNSPSASEVVLPERRENAKGLAAMVVRQSEFEAPPLNKRTPFPTSPFTPALSSPFSDLPTRREPPPPRRHLKSWPFQMSKCSGRSFMVRSNRSKTVSSEP